VGFVGFGDRGAELFQHVRASANTDVVAVCDVFSKQLEKAGALAPGAALYSDYRALLDDSSVDAVVIATPPHLHGAQFSAALDAGKHVYQEKLMAFDVADAKRMRAAYIKDAGRHAVEIGHQACSFGHMSDVRQFLGEPQRMGRITAIDMRMYRNTPHGKPQWSRTARATAEVSAENIDWAAFSDGPFDARRYLNWRLYWEYSGGSVFEHMSHQLGFWYKALDLQIPRAATMNGGVYLWKDGREVPDTMNVSLEQPEEILISWSAGFGNNQPGVTEDVLGDNGTITRDNQVRYRPQKINRPDGNEMTGRTMHVPQAHMQNFFDAIREGGQPNAGFEIGYRVSIAARMAVDSYRLGRTMRWDKAKEEIV
jgi:predicted dehydrogenase